MESLLEHSIKALEFWEALLVQYPESILCWKPSEDRWSIGQVYTHLQEETTYYLEQAVACAAHSKNTEQTLNPQGQAIFEAGALPLMRIDGPATHREISAFHTAADVKEMLEKMRQHWGQANKTVTTAIGNGKSPHPGLGYFSAAEWLWFAGMHLRHHEQLLVSDYLVHFHP